MKSILLVRKLLGLVEMTFALVNCFLQLARMASCKNDFLCPLYYDQLSSINSFVIVHYES